MSERRHAVTFAEQVPLHEGKVSRYYVTDCRCGWQSPLCRTRERAESLYHEHKAARRKRSR